MDNVINVHEAKLRVLTRQKIAADDDMFSPIQRIFQNETYLKRQKDRRDRYYELRQFRREHPILWRLGARPKQKR